MFYCTLCTNKGDDDDYYCVFVGRGETAGRLLYISRDGGQAHVYPSTAEWHDSQLHGTGKV